MLDSYIGQRDSLAMLMVTLRAREQREGRLPNMLFLGGPGRGKTTLAKAVADELDVPFVAVHGPSIRDAHGGNEKAAMAALLRQAEGGILFVDEIHSLSRTVAEDMYRAIDEGTISETVPVMAQATQQTFVTAEKAEDLPPQMRDQFQWRGPGIYKVNEQVEVATRQTETRQVQIGDVTIIGATTDEAMLPPAFLSRLSALTVRLRPYNEEEMGNIAIRHAFDIGSDVDAKAALELAVRGRQTPRRVKQLTERAAEWAIAQGREQITRQDVIDTCAAMGVDQHGLEEPHRQMLRLLAEQPKGLSRTSLAQRMGLPAKNADLYWGDLMEVGFVTIGTKHEITDKGREAIGA